MAAPETPPPRPPRPPPDTSPPRPPLLPFDDSQLMAPLLRDGETIETQSSPAAPSRRDLAYTLQLLDDWLEANHHLWQDLLEDSLAGF